MHGQAGFFDIDERLKELSAKGDNLERLNAIVTSRRSDLTSPAPCHVPTAARAADLPSIMCCVQGVDPAGEPLERTEFLIKDRLSFMRFLGLGLSDPVPDANTICPRGANARDDRGRARRHSAVLRL